MTKRIPAKLKLDAIIEAVFEIRFQATVIPEILYGRLLDHSKWKALERKRLPAYDLPASIRASDENLRYQPIWELLSANESIRFGPQVLSYHQRAPYQGWIDFGPKLSEAILLLFSQADDVVITRLGLRYIDALTPAHGITGVSDLDMSILVSDSELKRHLNLNFSSAPGEAIGFTARIATAEFVVGALPPDTSVYVDIDVYTPDGFSSDSPDDVVSWVNAAHDKGKIEFFGLLKQTTIDALEA